MTNDELVSTVKRLRIENEVNKIMIHSLKQTLLNHKNELIEECIESIKFTSDIVEIQIKQSWTEEETIFFKEEIEQEIKLFSLLNSNT
jgi:hypothetical protein